MRGRLLAENPERTATALPARIPDDAATLDAWLEDFVDEAGQQRNRLGRNLNCGHTVGTPPPSPLS